MQRCPYHQTVLDPAAAEHPRSGAADAGQGDGRTAGARFVAVHKIIEGLPPAGYRLSRQGIPGQNGRRAAGIGRIGIQRQPGRSDERAVRRVMRAAQPPRADEVGEGGFSLFLCFGDTSGADEGEESNEGEEFERGDCHGMKRLGNAIISDASFVETLTSVTPDPDRVNDGAVEGHLKGDTQRSVPRWRTGVLKIDRHAERCFCNAYFHAC